MKKVKTAIVQHKLSSLHIRIQKLLDKTYRDVPYDQEAEDIFERYNKLLLSIKEEHSALFADLAPRKPIFMSGDHTIDKSSIEILKTDIFEFERGLQVIDHENDAERRSNDVRYWSQRTRAASSKGWLANTLPATFAVIRRLTGEFFFSENFGNDCYYCGFKGGLSELDVNQRLNEEIPGLIYPPKQANENELFDFVEFFYRYTSKPTEWSDCIDGGKCPRGYSSLSGREKFSTEINAVFVRFGAPFRLVRGQIVRANSEIVDRILEVPIVTDDADLNGLIKRAVDAFQDKNDKRIEAAEICCKAFEHLKHRFGGNAKKSSEALIRQLVQNSEQFEKLNLYWSALTSLGHSAIRHSKPEVPSTSDPVLAEYLFVQYYTAILLASKKLEPVDELDQIFGLELTPEEVPF